MFTDSEYEAATKRGEQMAREIPQATAAHYDTRLRRILVVLNNGLEIAIAPERTLALQNATEAQLSCVEVWAGGYELYFADLDEGLWLPNIYQGSLDSTRWIERDTPAA